MFSGIVRNYKTTMPTVVLPLLPSSTTPLQFRGQVPSHDECNPKNLFIICTGPFGIALCLRSIRFLSIDFQSCFKLPVRVSLKLRIADRNDPVIKEFQLTTRGETSISMAVENITHITLTMHETPSIFNYHNVYSAKAFGSEKFADLYLVREGSRTMHPAHLFVMDQYTPYFTNAVKHNRSNQVKIPESEWEATIGLVKMCYSGVVDTTMKFSDALAMFICADALCFQKRILMALADLLVFIGNWDELKEMVLVHGNCKFLQEPLQIRVEASADSDDNAKELFELFTSQ